MKKLNFGRITLIVGGAVALIGSILYIALDGSDKTFSVIAFVLGLLGAASTFLDLLPISSSLLLYRLFCIPLPAPSF